MASGCGPLEPFPAVATLHKEVYATGGTYKELLGVTVAVGRGSNLRYQRHVFSFPGILGPQRAECRGGMT